MTSINSPLDAVVIGGGFYGAAIAVYIAKQRGLKAIKLVERESSLLTRASYNNQARVHNGYHYPRSYTTAYRSRINMPQFVRDWPEAVNRDFTKLYAIARHNSKVSARQFQRFCREIGAKLQSADTSHRQLFEPRLIEDVFLVEEYAFDAGQLLHWAEEELHQCGIQICLETSATAISRGEEGTSKITLSSKSGVEETVACRYVFNCTYSGLNQLGGDYQCTRTRLKQEITEIALVQAPSALSGLGVTVMDGPFFSMMPFPPRDLHTLSHVRYTPHSHWVDQRGINPYKKLEHYDHATRVDRMLRDVSRYLPAVLDATYVDSLFEIKTVLVSNEGDDGRPILFEDNPALPGCYSILGGKIDNIYDVILRLDSENIQ